LSSILHYIIIPLILIVFQNLTVHKEDKSLLLGQFFVTLARNYVGTPITFGMHICPPKWNILVWINRLTTFGKGGLHWNLTSKLDFESHQYFQQPNMKTLLIPLYKFTKIWVILIPGHTKISQADQIFGHNGLYAVYCQTWKCSYHHLQFIF
jgi:hypothetical protein